MHKLVRSEQCSDLSCTRFIQVHTMLWYDTTINSQFPVYPSMYYLVPLVGILANSAFQRNAQDIQCNGLYGDVYPEHSSEQPNSLVSRPVVQGSTYWDKQEIDGL